MFKYEKLVKGETQPLKIVGKKSVKTLNSQENCTKRGHSQDYKMRKYERKREKSQSKIYSDIENIEKEENKHQRL